MRVTLPKELRRAVEAKRLDETIVGEQTRAAAPHLTVIHDPAFLQVPEHDGFSVLLRENHFEGDVSSLTTLCQDHPFGGRSRLANLAAGREREWFQAYLQTLTVSLIRLYLDVGLTYEPHQQNTLLRLRDGLPDHALVRDSQGYFHREAAHQDICDGPPPPRRGSGVDLPRGARRRAARLLPVPQQRAGRDRRARRGRRDRRANPAATISATPSPASASRAVATRTRCWTACSTTRPGRARPTCARACTTWTSWSATSRRSPCT